MIDLLKADEIEHLENRMKRNPAIKDEVDEKYDYYKFCIKEIEQILPILRKYSYKKPEFPI